MDNLKMEQDPLYQKLYQEALNSMPVYQGVDLAFRLEKAKIIASYEYKKMKGKV